MTISAGGEGRGRAAEKGRGGDGRGGVRWRHKRWGEEKIVGGKENMEPREAINCGREKPQIVAPGSQYKNGSSSLGALWEEPFLEAFGRAPEEGRGGGGRGGAVGGTCIWAGRGAVGGKEKTQIVDAFWEKPFFESVWQGF